VAGAEPDDAEEDPYAEGDVEMNEERRRRSLLGSSANFDGELDAGELALDEMVASVEFEAGADASALDGSQVFATPHGRDAAPQQGADALAADPLAEPVDSAASLKAFVVGAGDVGEPGGGVLGLFELQPGAPRGATLGERVASPSAWRAFGRLADEMAGQGVRFAFSVEPTFVQLLGTRGWKLVAYQSPLLADVGAGDAFEQEYPESGRDDAEALDLARLAGFVRAALAGAPVGLIGYDNEGLYESLGRPVVCVYAKLRQAGGAASSSSGKSLGALKALVARVRALRAAVLAARPSNEPVFVIVDSAADAYELRFFSSELLWHAGDRAATSVARIAVRLKRASYVRMKEPFADASRAAAFVAAALRGELASVKLEGQLLQAAKGGVPASSTPLAERTEL
jgi:hypothetical protein